MRLTSLRSKIFLFVGLILLLGASLVMFVTQTDVTRTVATSEERALDNVLNLLIRDSEARWRALVTEKSNTARQARQPLIQYGNIIESVLQNYLTQVQNGTLTQPQAQAQALQWINSLDLGGRRYAFVLEHDPDLTVLASGQPGMTATQLGNHMDIKGQTFSQIAREDLHTSRYSFVIYRGTQPDASGRNELRYSWFSMFQPWGWVLAVSDSAQHIVDQFDQQQTRLEVAFREALRSLRLAGTGFAFILDTDNRLVMPLPARHANLLDTADTERPELTLLQLVQAIPPSGEIVPIHYDPIEEDGEVDDGVWTVKAAHIKPLGWTIVAVVPGGDLTRPATELRDRLGLLFLAGLLLSLAIAWILAARITRPLQQLSDFARQLPERDLELDEPLPANIKQLPQRHHDEVGRLATTIITMDKQLREKVRSLVQETSSRERFESELNIARDIQMGLLPLPLPPEILQRIDLHAIMIPAKEVGGDLYDYFLLPDGRLCFAIGDVSDKGVPAALFMAVTRTLIRASAEDETDPALLMDRVNNRLATNNPNLMFVTLIIGVLDLDSGALAWANGGHPPPCILQPDGTMRLLEGRSGPACGIIEGHHYQGYTTQLLSGETLFGYTDGISEAVGLQDQQYGEPRLYQQLSKPGAARTTACDQATALLHDVQEFVQDTEQSDDITLIIAKRTPS